MKETSSRLPGKGMRILSFIPVVNWFAVLYIGIINGVTSSIVFGAAYAVITFAAPSVAVVTWLVGMVHYAITYQGLKNRAKQSAKFSAPPRKQPQPTAKKTPNGYADVQLTGTTERKQTIPPRTQTPVVRVSVSHRDPHEKFFSDMKKNANRDGAQTKFVPFMSYWPTYDDMTREQQSWYFYWRSQVRQKSYPATDLSYIFVMVYELLSGVGWSNPEDGLQQLFDLWRHYQKAFPSLDRYLADWTFDFAMQHDLNFVLPIFDSELKLVPGVMVDRLIASHQDDVPLKLDFALIDAMCDYSLVGSKFYKEGNQTLMREAIPRTLALADASMLKATGKGVLATYGPRRTRKMEYTVYASALCPSANTKASMSEKAYSSSAKLRAYVNELVRYSENALRSLCGVRGRLRGVTLDEGTAKLIDGFLAKEYGKVKVPETKPSTSAAVDLDFESISSLRKESDAVRVALHVPEEEPVKELLTDVHEVTAIYAALSVPARILWDQLAKSDTWTCAETRETGNMITEINRFAEHYLGCALLIAEGDSIIVEDDYRDEMEYIRENPPVLTEQQQLALFDESTLSPELQDFVSALMPEQQLALHAVLTNEAPQDALNTIAEDALTMPQILLDDMNELAMRTLGDIIIDATAQTPFIHEEYLPQLHHAIA